MAAGCARFQDSDDERCSRRCQVMVASIPAAIDRRDIGEGGHRDDIELYVEYQLDAQVAITFPSVTSQTQH